jgi:DNA polymerase-3 subunit epsilon
MAIEHIVITDTETTGLDPLTSQVIEVACVVYSLRHYAVVESYSSLVYAESNAAERINRISPSLLRTAPEEKDVWRKVKRIAEDSGTATSVYAAHNAQFDRKFYRADVGAVLPWVCTMTDCEWPMSPLGSSCVNMALAHGVAVASAHRALTDCMLIANTMTRVAEMDYDLSKIIERAMRPKKLYAVKAKDFSTDRNALAKANGFQWNKPNWLRSMAPEDTAALPFDVIEVET